MNLGIFFAIRNIFVNTELKKVCSCGEQLQILVDLKKTLDTADREILIEKLWHYGMRGIANDWFKSYLTNRMQYISNDGISSDLLKANFGVPQESILGPLIYLLKMIYIIVLDFPLHFILPMIQVFFLFGLMLIKLHSI